MFRPDGRFAYVIGANGSIYSYRVLPNGALRRITAKSAAGGGGPHNAVLSANGRRLYVYTTDIDTQQRRAPKGYEGAIYQYAIGANGIAAPLTPAAVGVETQDYPLAQIDKIPPGNIALDPTGKYAYVPVWNGLDAYRIGPDGSLQAEPKSMRSMAPGSDDGRSVTRSEGALSNLVISKTGAFAYCLELSSPAVIRESVPTTMCLDYFQRNRAGRLVLTDRRGIQPHGFLTDYRDLSTQQQYGMLTKLALTPSDRSLIGVDAAGGQIERYALGAKGKILGHAPRTVRKIRSPSEVLFTEKSRGLIYQRRNQLARNSSN
ncbi:MAG: hypothetical protein ABIY70_09980 [Capsulimonas sp.]|uniref:hypothetical protein n=1 Tax=Capsulimonas sp. TaxID=2494211 RepID=UPI0032671C36